VVTRLVAPSVAPEPGRFEPSPLRDDAELQERLLALLGSERDGVAFVAKDLKTGRGAVHDPERVFYGASMFKLFVMYEAFRQESLGYLRFDDEVVITPYYDSFGLNPRSTSLCQSLTVSEAIDAMMSVSDNAAAVLLQDLVGAGNVNGAIAALGVRSSGLVPDGSLPLTAADVAVVLEALGRGEALSPEASDAMINVMRRDTFDNGIKGGVPDDVEVAHKTGLWNNATHDGALVFAPFGTYVIVVLTDRYGQAPLIRQLSQAVYEHFERIR
jgi:beta-lactamase class A